jgi:hypothetical protein
MRPNFYVQQANRTKVDFSEQQFPERASKEKKTEPSNSFSVSQSIMDLIFKGFSLRLRGSDKGELRAEQ